MYPVVLWCFVLPEIRHVALHNSAFHITSATAEISEAANTIAIAFVSLLPRLTVTQ